MYAEWLQLFQSTPSVWRETQISCSAALWNVISIHSLRVEGDCLVMSYGIRSAISIHSLRVEGDAADLAPNPPFGISIHSLRVEGDQRPAPPAEQGAHFNPLPPCGGRRTKQALRRRTHNFNPLPPCGGRRAAKITGGHLMAFQSTPSVWRETSGFSRARLTLDFNPLPPCGGRPQPLRRGAAGNRISIHSLRVEGDGS